MATVTPTRRIVSGGKALVFSWTLTEADTAVPVEIVDFADRSVQMAGSFGGGNVRIEGSNNDGATYAALTDPQGNDLNFSADKIEMVTELTQLLRPRVTAGAGVSVQVSLLARFTA